MHKWEEKIKTVTIKEIVSKDVEYNYNTSYQRNDAWNKKIKSKFIDSIMHNFFIPPILIANNEVIDGKQRILTIEKYANNEFSWKNEETNKNLNFDSLETSDKNKFLYHDIIIFNLGEMDDSLIIETFIRINNGSIKLNKPEMIFTNATKENKELVTSLAKSEPLIKICLNKKSDSRFQLSYLITRCLAVLSIGTIKTKGVRNWTSKILKKDLPNCLGDNKEIEKNVNKVISFMYSCLGIDVIPVKCFNTIFESIFVAIYQNLNSIKSFENNKEKIKEKIKLVIPKIINNQMGGGIKFDSIEYVNERVNQIKEILKDYIIDKKRCLNDDNKLIVWQNSDKCCNLCKYKFKDFKDPLIQYDHIVAHINGGKTKVDNCQLLCKSCNLKKAAS